MRYGIFSDVHANLEAFEAGLHFFRAHKVDSYIFVGDIVGYGADPQACFERLSGLDAVMVAGNHDWAVAGCHELTHFNQAAREAIIWTQHHVGPDAAVALARMPLIARTQDFECVHGTLSHPDEFGYMATSYEAMKTFLTMKTRLCFVGHSHVPGVYEDTGESLEYHSGPSLVLRTGHRYIVNAGSVGQPRDGDPHACLCIWETEPGRIDFHRIEYDIGRAQKKIRDAGLPVSLAERLTRGQ